MVNRLPLYEEMKEMNQQHLFTSKYINQQSFAEAELFEIANEEFEGSAIRSITRSGEKAFKDHIDGLERMIKGVK